MGWGGGGKMEEGEEERKNVCQIAFNRHLCEQKGFALFTLQIMTHCSCE